MMEENSHCDVVIPIRNSDDTTKTNNAFVSSDGPDQPDDEGQTDRQNDLKRTDYQAARKMIDEFFEIPNSSHHQTIPMAAKSNGSAIWDDQQESRYPVGNSTLASDPFVPFFEIEPPMSTSDCFDAERFSRDIFVDPFPRNSGSQDVDESRQIHDFTSNCRGRQIQDDIVDPIYLEAARNDHQMNNFNTAWEESRPFAYDNRQTSLPFVNSFNSTQDFCGNRPGSLNSTSRHQSSDQGFSSSYNSPKSDGENLYLSLQNENLSFRRPISETVQSPLLLSSSKQTELYYEYLRLKPFEEIYDETTESFVSSDPGENWDNNPARWEAMKRLGSDEERRNFARRQFSNPEQVNPTISSTYFGRSRLNIAEQFGIRYEPDGGVDQVVLREGILELLDYESPEWKLPSIRKRRREIDDRPWKRFRFVNFNDFQKEMFFKILELNYPKMFSGCKTLINNSYQRPCTAKNPCKKCHKRQQQNWTCYLRHFKSGMEERKTFIKLYRKDPDDPMDLIPASILERSIQVEKMFKEFGIHYGKNEDDNCSKCRTRHIFC